MTAKPLLRQNAELRKNNIPHFKKRQGDQTFGEMEAALTRHSRSKS